MNVHLLIGLAAGGLVSWLAVTLYAFWRAGITRDEKEQLESITSFYEEILSTNYQRPILLWRDEHITADDSSLSYLALSSPVTMLDDLFSEQAYEGCSLEAIKKIKNSMASGVAFIEPIEVYLGPNRPGVLIDIQIIANPELNWPSAVLWIEEVVARPRGKSANTKDDGEAAGLIKLIDALPFPVWQRNAAMKLERVNRAYVDAVDGGSERNVIRNNIELMEASSLQSVQKVAEEVIHSGKTIEKTQYSIIKGKRRALNVTNAVVKNNETIVGVAVDVTGQEEAYSELNRVLDAQSETLNHLQTPVAIFGPDKILRFYNNAFLRFCQLPEKWLAREPSQGELLDGLRDRRRLPEKANYPAWKKQILETYSELIEPHEEFWYLSDGTTHRVMAQPHPLGGMLMLLEDVSDKLALERSYNTLIAVQRETLDGLHDGVGVFGSDGRLKLFNPAFCVLWGMEQKDLEEEPHFEKLLKSVVRRRLKMKDNWKKLRNEIQAPTLGREVRAGRLTLVDENIVDYTIVPLPDGAVMIRLTNVTDTVGIQDALEDRNEALETADRLKSKFITNMSYELRTPLNSIIGFTEMLQEGMLGDVNEKQASYLGNILDASDELKNMISDVLDLAVIEAGGMVLDVQSFSVNELLDDLVILATPRIQSRGVGLYVQIDHDYGVMEGDRRRILQIIFNLLINAMQFSVKGSTVNLTISNKADMIVFNFTSDQISLLKDEWGLVMNAFQYGSSVDTRGGLGLDLALVRSFVELHKGRVELTGDINKGIQISCLIPLKQIT